MPVGKPCGLIDCSLRKPKARLWTGLSRSGRDIQPLWITVLTPAITYPFGAAFYSGFQIGQCKKLAKGADDIEEGLCAP